MNKLLLCLLALPLSLAAQDKKKITLEDIWKDYKFRVRSVPGFSTLEDGVRYTQLDQQHDSQLINVYNIETGRLERTLFNTTEHYYQARSLQVDEYSFSPDERKMLLLTESRPIYRRSVLHKVYAYDIEKGNLVLVDTGAVLHATFSPDGSKVAFVQDNNLYYTDLATNVKVQVTTDGKRNRVINGNCDWVYEEEFEFTRAFQWSPDGKNIAYYRFDETAVPEFTIPYYNSATYPTLYTYKYPKAGEPNSAVSIRIYNLATTATITPQTGSGDQYIPRIKWTNDPKQLCIFRLNRHQNRLDLMLADAATGALRTIYTEESPTYVEINDNLEFLPGNRELLINSERSGYNHLYTWNWETNKLTDLTPGNTDVETIVAVDKKRSLIYYSAAERTIERQLYAVQFDGKKARRITSGAGTHEVTPCDGNLYFLDKYSTISQAPVFTLIDRNGRKLRTLEENRDLTQRMGEYALGSVRLIEVPVDGYKLNGWMMRPPDFDSTKRYPVLMYQYSGPGSQQVADKFPLGDYFWHQMLAESGYIVVCVDGTGTGFRGNAFKTKTYLQLGKYESDDQIAAARYLGTLPYVDNGRIGIWGWSFGGFMSSTCILKGSDVFKAAIAVAPVTNWRYYDNIYTERYMRLPAENAGGYDDNAPEKLASKLKGKFLLIHGTADDNVHFQNSMMLVDGLIKSNKQFDSEFYPNKNHGIYGGITRYQLYRRMTDFIMQNL